ncbi:MAG: hypothetical protein KF795_25725 [Labilithrix sp.]|nr:hypothetical protein [Labilithrix sp.]
MMTLTRTVCVLGLSFSLLACPKKTDGASDAAADAAPAPAADAGGAAGDDVESVYPLDPNAPIEPLAQKLCAGLSEMPEKKRAACCSTTPGIVVAPECTRVLSAALRHKAVELSEASVDRCVAAFDKTLEGCDWVGPFPPGPPPECQGLLKGLLAEGAKCRSSLECAGSLRCRGVGPTTAGKCSPARAVGELCGGTTDTLATYVRQNDLDTQHPECVTGHCIKHRCAMPVLADGACQVTLDCAAGLQCLPVAVGAKKKSAAIERKCLARPIPTKPGEACPGGICGEGLQCIMNKCASRKAGGEECANDFECRGGCVRTGTDPKGRCGPRCDIR